MSTVALSSPTALAAETTPWPLRLLKGVSLREGWLTLLLLLGSLLVVVWTVEEARWVETPSLALTVVLAALAGMLLAKVRASSISLYLLGTVLGLAMVYAQAASQATAGGWSLSSSELNLRLNLWWGAAIGGGISTDTIPFAMMLSGLTWLIGFASAWAVFRLHNVWWAILPGAVGIITNLSYLPDYFLRYFFLYLLTAMLLLVRMHTLERRRRWDRAGLTYAASLDLFTLNDALWFSLLVFLAAVLLPLKPATSPQLRSLWEMARWPANRAEHEFNRLFSAVPAKKPMPFRTFGPTLPFQGPISLSDDPLFYVESPSPAYWRVRAYARYTSKGWVASPLEVHDIPWQPEVSKPQLLQGITELRYAVTPRFSSPLMIMASSPAQVDLPAQAEIMLPSSFRLSLSPSSLDRQLPADLQRALRSLRGVERTLTPSEAATALRRVLPADVRVTAVVWDSGEGRRQQVELGERTYLGSLSEALLPWPNIAALEVRRVHPDPLDVVGVRFKGRSGPGTRYEAVSLVSIVRGEALRGAGTDYPGWVTDRYLQLPESLPQRVRTLAQAITRDKSTPYEKAVAIESYLRAFPYTTDLEAPPFDADGVDYLLFIARKGYSDYFASTMTVLLRAVGVPARMVAGYAQGEHDSTRNAYIVRDKDSHGWTEAYFPGYGWIEFEPTPGRTFPDHTLARPPPSPGEGTGDNLEELLEEELLGLNAGVFRQSSRTNPLSSPLALAGLSLVMLILGGAGILWHLYRRIFILLPSGEQAYERMCLLGALGRVGPRPQQTPLEYARSLAARFPSLRGHLQTIVDLYIRMRYGKKPLSPEEEGKVLLAWHFVRERLVRHLLRR